MKKICYSLLVLFLLNACGFKIVNRSAIPNYYISKIETKGDKKINYMIKNNFSGIFNDQNDKPLDLFIETTKTKTIKEKNIKNEITKQLITIDVKVKFSIFNKNEGEIFISKSGEYNESDRYSQTLADEKKLIEVLTDNISDEIIISLTEKINDL